MIFDILKGGKFAKSDFTLKRISDFAFLPPFEKIYFLTLKAIIDYIR